MKKRVLYFVAGFISSLWYENTTCNNSNLLFSKDLPLNATQSAIYFACYNYLRSTGAKGTINQGINKRVTNKIAAGLLRFSANTAVDGTTMFVADVLASTNVSKAKLVPGIVNFVAANAVLSGAEQLVQKVEIGQKVVTSEVYQTVRPLVQFAATVAAGWGFSFIPRK